MKKLIFIDNDNEKSANSDSDNVKNNLEMYFNVPSELIENMLLVPNFSQLSRDEAYEILFNSNNVVLTWSMYTPTHYNSLGQFIKFLAGAGRNKIKGMVYIDGSGELKRVMDSILENNPTHLLPIIKAIEQNYIISFDSDKNLGYRIRCDFSGQTLNNFKGEEVDLLDLILKSDNLKEGDWHFTRDYSDVIVGDKLLTRTGEGYIITKIEKDDCGRNEYFSNEKIVATQYSEGHNMFTKQKFFIKKFKQPIGINY